MLTVVLKVPTAFDSDLLLHYKLYEGDRLVCMQQTPDTLPIIQNAIGAGKNVAVPRIYIEDENKVMYFYRINNLDELMPGFYGIPEPDESHTIPYEPKDALVIVPGLVFDKNMYRIGYGGGFYDKYLSEQGRKNYKKLAVAFDFQVLKEEYIETDANDIPVDMIITEKTEYC